MKANGWLIAGLLLVLLVSAPTVQAQSVPPGPSASLTSGAAQLQKADSLFSSRQYTQAFDLYLSLHQQHLGSPAMFLKMAYIQEGLGHLGESLFYLNLYSQVSHDRQASQKMSELAEKNNLEGYEEDPFEVIARPLREYYAPIAGLLSALALLAVALQVNRARQHRRPSPWLGLLLLLILAGLFTHVQYSRRSHLAIVTHPVTYLMNGPSSAASVIEIIGEGHQLRVQQQQDVWLKVKWRDGDAYVRDFLVRKVEL
ncbi:MAG: hypothetical protein JNL40_03420 [Cyclobacteriaceae bacterium]|nr:hypothetical protein [Cyclobacteriaceae bacterium]